MFFCVVVGGPNKLLKDLNSCFSEPVRIRCFNPLYLNRSGNSKSSFAFVESAPGFPSGVFRLHGNAYHPVYAICASQCYWDFKRYLSSTRGLAKLNKANVLFVAFLLIHMALFITTLNCFV